MITVQGLTTGFGKKTILRDVSFEAHGPCIIGLVGPNGCGKSTLLKALANVHPFSGEVLFDGTALRNYPTKQRVQQLSYVAQHTGDAIPLTVHEVVKLGRQAGRNPFAQDEADDEAMVQKALMHAGLTAIADTALSELSGGQIQRAMVARAMAQQSNVMLLDEPTNHLDLHHQHKLMNMLVHLATQHNTIVILAIHDLELAARFCDRLLLLDGGTLAKDDTPLATLTPDVLANVFRIDARFTRSALGYPSLEIHSALGNL